MTISHFSNSDNAHCQIKITFKWYYKINSIHYIFKQEILYKNLSLKTQF